MTSIQETGSSTTQTFGARRSNTSNTSRHCISNRILDCENRINGEVRSIQTPSMHSEGEKRSSSWNTRGSWRKVDLVAAAAAQVEIGEPRGFSGSGVVWKSVLGPAWEHRSDKQMGLRVTHVGFTGSKKMWALKS